MHNRFNVFLSFIYCALRYDLLAHNILKIILFSLYTLRSYDVALLTFVVNQREQ